MKCIFSICFLLNVDNMFDIYLGVKIVVFFLKKVK